MYIDLDYDLENEMADPLSKLEFLTECPDTFGNHLASHSADCYTYVSIVNDYVVKTREVFESLVCASLEVASAQREAEKELQEAIREAQIEEGRALYEKMHQEETGKAKKSKKKTNVVPIKPTE